MHHCERCQCNGRYDKHPESLLGKIWKRDIGWRPGWKSYLKSMAAIEIKRIMKLLDLPQDSRVKTFDQLVDIIDTVFEVVRTPLRQAS